MPCRQNHPCILWEFAKFSNTHSVWKSRDDHGGPLMMAAVCRPAAASEEDKASEEEAVRTRCHPTCLSIRPRINESRLYGPAPAEMTTINITA
jgi:hypothetical protein